MYDSSMRVSSEVLRWVKCTSKRQTALKRTDRHKKPQSASPGLGPSLSRTSPTSAALNNPLFACLSVSSAEFVDVTLSKVLSVFPSRQSVRGIVDYSTCHIPAACGKVRGTPLNALLTPCPPPPPWAPTRACARQNLAPKFFLSELNRDETQNT